MKTRIEMTPNEQYVAEQEAREKFKAEQKKAEDRFAKYQEREARRQSAAAGKAAKKQAKADAKEHKVLQEPPHVMKGSREEAEMLREFEYELYQVDDNMTKYIADRTLEKQQKPINEGLDMINMMYHRRMFAVAASPLSQGVNAGSIIESMGMLAGMCLASPSFRKTVKNTVRNALYPVAEKMAMKNPNSAWAAYRDKVLREENNGRLPLTGKSAAIMQIGFLRGAYAKMRQPDANVSDVLNEYDTAVGLLNEQAEHDGVSKDDIALNMRTIIGQMVERDPNLAHFVEELGYGTVTRDPDRQVEVDGQTYNSWCGEYTSKDGEPFTDAFHPRVPASEASYSNMWVDFVRDNIKDCKSYKQVHDKFNSPDFVRGRDEKFQMMMDDGFSDESIKNMTTKLFGACVRDWEYLHPDAVAEAYRQSRQNVAMSRRFPDDPSYAGDDFGGGYGYGQEK